MSERRKSWKTTLPLYSVKESLNAGDVSIFYSIFKGESLSPHRFFLDMMSLTELLNDVQRGYKTLDKYTNHLLYMDGLKLFRKNMTNNHHDY